VVAINIKMLLETVVTICLTFFSTIRTTLQLHQWCTESKLNLSRPRMWSEQQWKFN